ncbi:MAG: HlyD family efflux transporter periplasmic adaptor subunit [Planctomycetota bacterium]|nr:HlyD family efflux transporter periplasmic adaptor subunit [Planctomycetota bacterium]
MAESETESADHSPYVTAIRFVAPLLIIAVGIGTLSVFGQRETPPRNTGSGDDAVIVETARVEAFDGTFDLRLDGEAVSYALIQVGAEVAGRVSDKPDRIRGGKVIGQGELLFQLDDAEYKLVVERLTVDLRKAGEDIIAADIDLANVRALQRLSEEQWALEKTRLARAERLIGQNAANNADVDAARREELAARNSLQSLRNQDRALEQKKKTLQTQRDLVDTQLREAELNLRRTSVKAPVTGSVVGDTKQVGDYVRAGDRMLVLSDSSRMEVKCNLRIDELVWVWRQAGQGKFPEATKSESSPQSAQERLKALAARIEMPKTPVQVLADFEGHEIRWDGVLSRYEGTGLDPETRTAPVRILVDRPTESRMTDSRGIPPSMPPPALTSGMFVRVRIPIRSPNPLLQLPAKALRPGGQVWVVDDAKLRIVEVDVARELNDFVLLRLESTTLKAGDRVITSPLATVHDGMHVQSAKPND